jgi:DNA-binding XRE family transcriptional regulator
MMTTDTNKRTMPPLLLECLIGLRQPYERGFAMARTRLALRINYNPQTIMHWESGRRPIGPDGLAALRKVRDSMVIIDFSQEAP